MISKASSLREEFEIHKFRLVESFNSEVFFKGDFTDHRTVYREDLRLLKKKIQTQEKEGEETSTGGGRGIRTTTSSHGRKGEVPEDSLSLQFVHG